MIRPDRSPAAPPTSTAPPAAVRGAGAVTGRVAALVLAASFLAATLASAGTVLVATSDPPIGSAADPGTTIGSDAVAVATGATSETGSGASAGATISAADALVAVARSATPAVVTIEATGSRLFAFGSSGGEGSGFVYDASGLILTNAHVVAGAAELTATLLDGRHFPATVVAEDDALDLAILRIAGSDLPTVALGISDPIATGQTLVVIGSPLGTYTGSVTSGILSATDRTITVTNELTGRPQRLTGLLQTDAAINPGNSGGPVLDLAGNVVGIATATSSTAEGIGFAVPIGAARSLLDRAARATT